MTNRSESEPSESVVDVVVDPSPQAESALMLPPLPIRRPTGVRSIKIVYVFAVGLLAALACANYALLQKQIDLRENGVTIVNLSGRQVMLTQRISYMARQLVENLSSAERADLRRRLLDAANNLEKSHRSLLNGDASINVGKLSSWQLQAIYFGPPFFLDSAMTQYINEARALSSALPSELTAANRHYRYIRNLSKNDVLLVALDQMAQRFRSERDATFDRNKDLGRLELSITLSILFFLAMFVFWPLTRRIEREIEKLERTNAALDRSTHKLTDAYLDLKKKESVLRATMGDLETERGRLQREIAGRQKIEDALKREKDAAQMYLDMAGTVFVVVDRDLNIRLINQKGCDLLGRREADILGRAWVDDVVASEERDRLRSIFMNLLNRKRETSITHESSIVTAAGVTRTIAWHSTVIKGERGEVQAILSSGEDITERKKAEEELMKLNLALGNQANELARSNSDLEQFAYVASHDLQEPLQKIAVFGDLLSTYAQSVLDEKGKEYVKRMQAAASRMSRLIEDLLQFSRVTMKTSTFEQVRLNHIVEEVLSDLELRIVDSGATFEIEVLPEVLADRSQMYQLFKNLVSNAIKYRKKETAPKIAIRAKAVDGKIADVSVEDNGIGFEEKFLTRIFKPFERLHSASKYEGSGIGLAVCDKIVHRHGWEIFASSRPGEGSTFTIRLAYVKMKSAAAPARPPKVKTETSHTEFKIV